MGRGRTFQQREDDREREGEKDGTSDIMVGDQSESGETKGIGERKH